MAIKEMEKTANEVVIRWDLNKVVVRHVVGTKKVGEPVVVVGASSAHRTACFEACRFLIYLKGKGAYLEKGNF